MKPEYIKCMNCDKDFLKVIINVLFCSGECEIAYIKKEERNS